MINESEFQNKVSETIEELEELILPISDEHGFDVESAGGMLTLTFEEPTSGKFMISPNAPARQIWVSALATSYKFDWDESADSFVLDKTREPIRNVIGKLLSQQLGVAVQL